MKIRIFLSFLSFFSLYLVHDCQAGSNTSKAAPDEKKTVTPPPPTQTRQQQNQRLTVQQERAIVPYKFFKYNYNPNDDKAIVEIPYPDKATFKIDMTIGSTFSNEIYQIWLMDEEMKGKNKHAQELEMNRDLEPKNLNEVQQWFLKVPQDMKYIGDELKGFDLCAYESMKTMAKHAEGLKLDKIWQTVRLKRNRESLESYLYFKMEDNTYIMFHVLPLPQQLWRSIPNSTIQGGQQISLTNPNVAKSLQSDSVTTSTTPSLGKSEINEKENDKSTKVVFKPKETSELLELFQKANSGDKDACFELGNYLYQEEHSRADKTQNVDRYKTAIGHLQVAANKGHQEAQKLLDLISPGSKTDSAEKH